MSAKSDLLRARRTRWIHGPGSIELLVARPRALEIAQWSADGNAGIALRCVIDWRGVTWGDVSGDGDATQQPFDADIRDEWLPDRPDLLVSVWETIQALITEHAAQAEADRKNS